MAKEKQIEELKNILLEESNRFYGLECDEACAYCEASAVFDAGYRKQSEVAKEIFDEIERILSLNYCCCLPQGVTEHYEYYEGNIAKDIAELKKKYTEQN